MADNLQLEKTLQVDGQAYDINAVQADKVANKLIINRIALGSKDNKTTTLVADFDGNTEKSIAIVPADEGGRFAKRITVPPVSDATLSSDGETVLNYTDIVSKVIDRLLNTSAMATWNNNELSFTNTEKPAVHGICTVLGTETDVASFAETNNANWIAANSENPPDPISKWLPNYLYICSDTRNIYFGTASSTEAKQLASDENKALEPKYIRIAGKGGIDDKGGYRWVIPKSKNPDKNLPYVVYRNHYRDEDGNILEGDDTTVDGGLDLSNSDIVNVNGMWFAERADVAGEGLMFLYRDKAKIPFKLDPRLTTEQGIEDIERTIDKWDRLYANQGHLYFSIGETSDKIIAANYEPDNDPDRREVLHTGMTNIGMIIKPENGGTGETDLKDVKVGFATEADTAKTAETAAWAEASSKADTATAAGTAAWAEKADKADTAASATNADSAKKATQATQATQDSDGKQINYNYYRCDLNTSKINTITIKSSTSYPDGIPTTVGNDGDIMILY